MRTAVPRPGATMPLPAADGSAHALSIKPVAEMPAMAELFVSAKGSRRSPMERGRHSESSQVSEFE
ncbi:hypothetical protein K663_07840 [Sphingobium sp. MI1205]|nr:hypothetical protein K663_07840 [Sphingobium sp. MI1205]